MTALSAGSSLSQSCVPRASAFAAAQHDIALDLGQLNTIDAAEFFAENHATDGMKQLWTKAFQRFTGASGQGVFVLSQAMGGGKTHAMISLALLARDPAVRTRVLAAEAPKGLAAVRVAAFSGRETDYPYGVWGAIAERIGRKEAFGEYYSPPKAPGPEAWKQLLAGAPTLILLDEMPPYFEYARSVPLGNASLAEVTTAALSNLLVAVGSNQLANVVVVIADLKGTYGSGSSQLNQALVNLDNEAARSAQALTPVGLNTDEVYHILRRRLFLSLPDADATRAVAKAYADAVEQAVKLGLTDEKPSQIANEIVATYPFHPALKDLLARFRDNPGFQQTRGLIRLMRAVVARLWRAGAARPADTRYLIGAEDIDLNDPVILADIQAVNGTLTNAIAHDVAANGRSEAEAIDRDRQRSATISGDAQDAATVLLISSLADTTNAMVGLNDRELIGMMARPGRDLSRLPSEVLKELQSRAWYLHLGRDGRFFFKNVENITSKVRRYTQNFLGQSARLELKAYLGELFKPTVRDCYQEVQVFAPLDEIALRSDRIALILIEPHSSGQLSPEIVAFWKAQQSRNRVAFLTGARMTMQRLVETAAARKAVAEVLGELDQDKVPDRDPVRQQAAAIREQIEGNLQQAARETFSTLYYPYGAAGQADKLQNCDFTMTFTGSRYDGESEVRKVLVKRGKFLEHPTGTDFRQRVEDRLFTQPLMTWNLLKERAATNSSWWWYHAEALENLKADSLAKDFWRAVGDQVQKPPFEQESTSVLVSELGRNDDGSVDLRLTARHGNAIYYDAGGAEATAASTRVVEPGKPFRTTAIRHSFLCIDETGAHPTGKACGWINRPEVKSGIHQRGEDRLVELQALPHGVIRYTTDGSDPKVGGGSYDGAFVVGRGVRMVCAVAEAEGVYSEVHNRPISWDSSAVQVDAGKPAVWKRPQKTASAAETYSLIERLRKFHASLDKPHLTVQRANDEKAYLELSAGGRIQVTPDQLESSLAALLALLGEPGSQTPIITTDGQSLRFETGKDLLAWVADRKTELKPGEVEQ